MYLFEMVPVDVVIAERVDELARFEFAHVREHVRQERVGTDVEGHADEQLGMKILCITFCVWVNATFEYYSQRTALSSVAMQRQSTVPIAFMSFNELLTQVC